MIYTPLLIIDYRERSKTYIATNSLADVSFTSNYTMDTTYYWKVIQGLFIGAMVLYGILLIGQMCIWSFSPQLSDV